MHRDDYDATLAARGTDRSVHWKRSACRCCGGANLRRFLELGPTPLANSFLHSPEEFAAEPSFPLDVYFCGTCSLVQLLDVIHPDILFGNYIYVTGTSQTMAEHHRAYAQSVVDRLGLTPSHLVVEVASNDGTLLRQFQERGVQVLGVEPASNIAELANEAGIPTLNRFFNLDAAREIRRSHGPAAAVAANNVLAHVDDPLDFLRGCRELLGSAGLLVIEVPHLAELVRRLEYDTIYHEHLCYFSALSLSRLCENAGLRIVSIERVPVHGGSLRVYAGRQETQPATSDDALEVVDEERRIGLDAWPCYEAVGRKAAESRGRLVDFLWNLKRSGRRIAAYGAPAKGNTLLNYCAIGPDLVEFTVDRNPLKVGLFTPGMHIPVKPVETLAQQRPDYALALAWNFLEEILRQQQEYRNLGGRFIVPIPEPKVV